MRNYHSLFVFDSVAYSPPTRDLASSHSESCHRSARRWERLSFHSPKMYGFPNLCFLLKGRGLELLSVLRGGLFIKIFCSNLGWDKQNLECGTRLLSSVYLGLCLLQEPGEGQASERSFWSKCFQCSRKWPSSSLPEVRPWWSLGITPL